MRRLLISLVFSLFTITGINPGFSCNLTNVNLITVSGSGPYTISTQLCVGAGRTGFVNGADGPTFDILFCFYTPGGAPITFSSFTSSLTSTFAGCTMFGFDIGPLPFAPYNSHGNIYFAFDSFEPGCANGFTCITSTAACGNVHSDCFNVSFTVDIMPDSIRVFGVEGAGNPEIGCTPNPDMLIDFSFLPIVWNSVLALATSDSQTLINWSTFSESGVSSFRVEKSALNSQAGEWTVCGEVPGTNTGNLAEYSFMDESPLPGLSYYRIRQVETNGDFSFSEVVSVLHKDRQDEIYPNPASTSLNIRVKNLKQGSLLDLFGEPVLEFQSAGEEMLTLPIENLPRGIYSLELKYQDQSSSFHKIAVE